MRLTHFEIEAIVNTFKEVFKEGDIYLFGSRVDEHKKGGDIDLYIDAPYKDDLMDKKIDFLVKLKAKIGEQKIDVVLSRDKNRPIEKIAQEEGIMLNTNRIRVEKYINECEKHKIRVEKSHAKVNAIFPLSASRYEQLSDEEIEAIDQYLFRFSKLQDTLGQKLFKLIISEYVEDINQLTFLDILNHLEKIDILETSVWKRLRDVRNNIAHQYDDEPQEMAEALNNIFAYKDALLAVFSSVDNFYKKKNERQS